MFKALRHRRIHGVVAVALLLRKTGGERDILRLVRYAGEVFVQCLRLVCGKRVTDQQIVYIRFCAVPEHIEDKAEPADADRICVAQVIRIRTADQAPNVLVVYAHVVVRRIDDAAACPARIRREIRRCGVIIGEPAVHVEINAVFRDGDGNVPPGLIAVIGEDAHNAVFIGVLNVAGDGVPARVGVAGVGIRGIEPADLLGGIFAAGFVIAARAFFAGDKLVGVRRPADLRLPRRVGNRFLHDVVQVAPRERLHAVVYNVGIVDGKRAGFARRDGFILLVVVRPERNADPARIIGNDVAVGIRFSGFGVAAVERAAEVDGVRRIERTGRRGLQRVIVLREPAYGDGSRSVDGRIVGAVALLDRLAGVRIVRQQRIAAGGVVLFKGIHGEQLVLQVVVGNKLARAALAAVAVAVAACREQAEHERKQHCQRYDNSHKTEPFASHKT